MVHCTTVRVSRERDMLLTIDLSLAIADQPFLSLGQFFKRRRVVVRVRIRGLSVGFPMLRSSTIGALIFFPNARTKNPATIRTREKEKSRPTEPPTLYGRVRAVHKLLYPTHI
jgi:hypothetical protein